MVENYVCLPMRHSIGTCDSRKTVAYEWHVKDEWCELRGEGLGSPQLPHEGSLEQFITEHYRGYSNQGRGASLEYEVTHAPWKVWVSATGAFEGDAEFAAWFGTWENHPRSSGLGVHCRGVGSCGLQGVPKSSGV